MPLLEFYVERISILFSGVKLPEHNDILIVASQKLKSLNIPNVHWTSFSTLHCTMEKHRYLVCLFSALAYIIISRDVHLYND